MIQQVHILTAARGAALLVLLVCLLRVYRDVSDFLRGNFSYTGKVFEQLDGVEDAPAAPIWGEDKFLHLLLV